MILFVLLAVVITLLLLCLIPGHPVLSLVLPFPKAIVTPLDPIVFQEITPPVGGGVSRVIFPVSGTSVTPPPTCPSSDPVCLPPVPPDTDLTVNGSDDPIEISNGSSALLNWVTTNNPTSCGASGAWSGSKNPAGGSEETGPLFGPKRYKYKITCSNDYGSASDVSTVIVSGPPGGGGGGGGGGKRDKGGGACVVCPAPQTISGALSFSNNNLVSGVFPELNLTAPPEGGSVNISASISPPLGGSCLNLPGPFRVWLYDNNTVKFGGPGAEIYGTFGGWSGNFPEFFAEPGSTHTIKLVVQTNCAGGAIQSIVNFVEASMTAVGPSPAVCPLSQNPLLPIKFANNELVSGSLPEYQFTAFDGELVKVNASVAGYTGGPCLAPPYRVSLYDNNTLKFGPINASGSNWSDNFPDFTVAPGQHKIKLAIATNCAGSQNAPIQSLVSFPDVSLDVQVLNVPADAPQICEQAIVSNLMDFGDAPDIPAGHFPSLEASNGARHKDVSKFYLGEKVDKEPDSHQVDRDSPIPTIGPDDGLFATPSIIGAGAGVPVLWELSIKIKNADWEKDKPIFLNVLYDFNGDFTWEAPNEHIVIDKEFHIDKGSSQIYNIPLVNPNGDLLNWVRLTVTDGKLGSNYDGSWPIPFEYGETEDHFRAQLPTPHDTITSLWHRIGHSQGFSITTPRQNPPGTTVGENPERFRVTPDDKPVPFTVTDVPTFDPTHFTPVKSGDNIIGLHETAITNFVPVKPFPAELLPGQPPYFEPIYDETGKIVSLHGVHNTNLTSIKTAIIPPVFAIPEIPQPPQNFRVIISRPGAETEGFFSILADKLLGVIRSFIASEGSLTPYNRRIYVSVKETLPRPTFSVPSSIEKIIIQYVPQQIITVPSVPQAGTPTVVQTPASTVQYALKVEDAITVDNVLVIEYRVQGDPVDIYAVPINAQSQKLYSAQIRLGRFVGFGRFELPFSRLPSNTAVIQVEMRKDNEVLASGLGHPFRVGGGGVTPGGGGGGGCSALSITTTSPLPDAAELTAYSKTLTASGGTSPLSWSNVGVSLPAGLVLSSAGVISGTPDPGTLGTYSLTIRVTDSCSPVQTKDKALTLEVTSGH